VAALPNGASGPEVAIAKGFLVRLGLLAPLVVLVAGLVAGLHGLETALFALGKKTKEKKDKGRNKRKKKDIEI
jgi:hypothetical protein